MKVSKGMLLIVALFAIGSVHPSEKRRKSSSKGKARVATSKEAAMKKFIEDVCIEYGDEAICRKGFVTDRKGHVKVVNCAELDDIAEQIARKYPRDYYSTRKILHGQISRHWDAGTAADVRAMQEYADAKLREYSIEYYNK